ERSGDCVRRCRRSAGPCRRRHDRPCRRGTGGQHFPLWRAHGWRRQAFHGGARHSGETGMSIKAKWLNKVRWDEHGLVPVIVQQADSNDVLMFAWMNREALSRTVELGEAVFWSRSRKKLWHKGEESGHIQKVRDIRLDCDEDVL